MSEFEDRIRLEKIAYYFTAHPHSIHYTHSGEKHLKLMEIEHVKYNIYKYYQHLHSISHTQHTYLMELLRLKLNVFCVYQHHRIIQMNMRKQKSNKNCEKKKKKIENVYFRSRRELYTVCHGNNIIG